MAGDCGARALAKLLHVNQKLSIVHWDRNNTSPHGLSDVAAAMHRSVLCLPYINNSAWPSLGNVMDNASPHGVSDVAAAMHRSVLCLPYINNSAWPSLGNVMDNTSWSL